MKELLPIGSVVMLKNATKSLMIVGTTQRDDEGKDHDYISVLFPEGFIDSDTFFLFDHEDIVDVKFIGCINGESQTYIQLLKNNEFHANKEKDAK